MSTIIEDKSLLIGFSINKDIWSKVSEIKTYTIKVCNHNTNSQHTLSGINLKKVCLLKCIPGIMISFSDYNIQEINKLLNLTSSLIFTRLTLILWNNGFVQVISNFEFIETDNEDLLDSRIIDQCDDLSSIFLNNLKEFIDNLVNIKVLHPIKPLYFADKFLLPEDKEEETINGNPCSNPPSEIKCIKDNSCLIPKINQKSAISSYHIIRKDDNPYLNYWVLNNECKIRSIRGCHLYEWVITKESIDYNDLAVDFISNSKCSLYCSKIKTAKSIARNQLINKSFHINSIDFRDILTAILDIENGLEILYMSMSTKERELTVKIDNISVTRKRTKIARDAENNLYNLLRTIDEEISNRQAKITQVILISLTLISTYGPIKEYVAKPDGYNIFIHILLTIGLTVIIAFFIHARYMQKQYKKFKIKTRY